MSPTLAFSKTNRLALAPPWNNDAIILWILNLKCFACVLEVAPSFLPRHSQELVSLFCNRADCWLGQRSPEKKVVINWPEAIVCKWGFCSLFARRKTMLKTALTKVVGWSDSGMKYWQTACDASLQHPSSFFSSPAMRLFTVSTGAFPLQFLTTLLAVTPLESSRSTDRQRFCLADVETWAELWGQSNPKSFDGAVPCQLRSLLIFSKYITDVHWCPWKAMSIKARQTFPLQHGCMIHQL